MRTARRLMALFAVVTLVLTGCGANTGGQGPAGGSAASGSSDGSFPQTVATAFGNVTIDKKPERVVALGWGDAEVALELGAQPVGASDWLAFGGQGVGPWSKGRYKTAPKIINTLKPDYEQIAALKPDLILDVHSSGDSARNQKLSQIAPTVGIPKGGQNYLTDMDTQTTMIAKALGVPEKGTALLKKVDSAYDKVARAHPQWRGRTVTAATRTSEGWGAYIEGGSRLDSLERLGLVQNPTIAKLPKNDSGFSVSISSENLDQMNADVIVAFPIYIPTTRITADARWKQLEAVKKGHDVVIDGDLSAAYSLGTPGASLYALDKLTPRLEKALPAAK